MATWCALPAAAQTAPDEASPATTAPLPDDPELECSEYVPPEDRKDPERLALRGVACFEAGEYLLALRHYRQARELSDENLLNAAIGRTFQELGYPFMARRYYRDYLGGHIDASQGRQRIEERLNSVEAQLAHDAGEVKITSAPPGTEVYLVVAETHREPLGPTPLTVKMLPGEHRFVLEDDGYLPQTHDVKVQPGASRELNTEMVDEEAAFAVSGRTLRRAGIITMASGTPLVATGTALWLVGHRQKKDAEEITGDITRNEEIMKGSRLQRWGLVSGVVGVTALATGFVLWWAGHSNDASSTTPDDETDETNAVKLRVTPILSVDYVGISGRF
jgi:hypothetical protein